MRTLKIDSRALIRVGACRPALARFNARHPHGITLTDSQQRNFDLVAPLADEENMRWGDTDDKGTAYGWRLLMDLYWLADALDCAATVEAFTGEGSLYFDVFSVCGLLADIVARRAVR